MEKRKKASEWEEELRRRAERDRVHLERIKRQAGLKGHSPLTPAEEVAREDPKEWLDLSYEEDSWWAARRAHHCPACHEETGGQIYTCTRLSHAKDPLCQRVSRLCRRHQAAANREWKRACAESEVMKELETL